MDDQTKTEPSNSELLKKYPEAKTRAEALELWKKDQAAAESRDDEADFQAGKAEQEPAHEVERRERRAELARHPHTQLRAILSNLNAPANRAGDITTRVATLHAAFTQLVQQVLQHTPPPDDSEEKINEDFKRKQQPAEGTDGQEPSGRRQQHEAGQDQRLQ
jgi:hypothetical protein